MKVEFLENRSPLIIQVGCGATGSHLVQHITQMLSIYPDLNGGYVIADHDIVERKNLKNQLFVSKDIGQFKAEVLAKRYSGTYQFPVYYYQESYIESIEDIFKCFDANPVSYSNMMPFLISCVDNNYTRKIFHEFFQRVSNLVYIDVGNEAATIPDNCHERPWTQEEQEKFNETGFTGQVVVGIKYRGQTLLKPLASVYSDVLTDADDIKPSVSCGTVVASAPQKLITNRFSALAVAGVLNEMFDTKTVTNHIINYHAQKGYMRGITVDNSDKD